MFIMNCAMIVILLVYVITEVYSFIRMTKEQREEKSEEEIEKLKVCVQEWLLGAVARAEKELGGGTGQLKLRTVYEMFVKTFPTMVTYIPFTDFSDMVDIALIKFRDMLEKNEKIKTYVEE